MRIVSILGTRPQLIKAAALEPVLRAAVEATLIDTGQHWDQALAGGFFDELGLPPAEHALGIGGGGHADQTGRMLVALEPLLATLRPDAVVVYGDTNSTLAGALAAAKLGLPVAHVEAGLRSFDRAMPEELNRIVSDHLSRWCLAPTPAAVANLAREGLAPATVLVGDLMQDLVAQVLPQVRDPFVLDAIAAGLGAAGGRPLRLAPGRFVYATVHRAENRTPTAMAAWMTILAGAATAERPVILALHPGTRAALAAAGLGLPDGVRVVEPVGYRTSLALQLHAAAVLTDSGGVQRESAWLGTPCLILRSTTEWLEAVAGSSGAMVVVGTDVDRALTALGGFLADDAADRAAARASAVAVAPAGAAAAILAAITAGPPPGG